MQNKKFHNWIQQQPTITQEMIMGIIWRDCVRKARWYAEENLN